MIDVTEAVGKAKEAFLALHEEDPVEQLRVAEAELSHDDKTWFITLSYYDSEVSGISKHKILSLDAETGIVRAMKVRAL